MSRADFFREFKPLPAGVSGNITISEYSAHQNGDVATTVHTDDENEFYHGQHLTAQYITTETWQRQDGAWKILMVHAYSVLKEPRSITLPAAELDAYVGRYSAAPELSYTIRREGDHLVGERGGPSGSAAESRDPRRILCERPAPHAKNLRSGQRWTGRWIF